jgi:hypothetical protein
MEVGKMVRKILALADMHVLSFYGLAPEKWQGEDGSVIHANEGQKLLFRYWKHLMSTVNKEEKWHPEEVWVVGDVFAGLNPVERGRGVRGSLDEQMKCAVELLEMLPDDVLVKVWSGSAYHESVDVRMHERLVDNLKLDGFQAKFRGSWSVESIGKRKNAFVAHEASSSIMYPATVMARDANYFKIAAFDGKLPEIHLVVRAHKHSKMYQDLGRMKVIQLPSWCVFMPYSKSLRMFPAWQSDIGAMFIFLDEEDRIKVQEWIYPSFSMTEQGEVIMPKYDKKSFVRGW